MSPGTCCMSLVTCHMSLTQTSADKDPPPAYFPTTHSRLACKDLKT